MRAVRLRAPLARCIPFLLVLPLLAQSALAVSPGNSAFQHTWARTDGPVVAGQASRTWMWGPEAFTGLMQEEYVNSPGDTRTVQYFDKSRMEITNPDAVDDGVWYVTNGLLVVELVTGQMQTGNTDFQPHSPAEITVAGDADDATGPTYATFNGLQNLEANAEGSVIIQRVSRGGTVSNDTSLADSDVRAVYHVADTGHTIAGPFWEFMNSAGPVSEGGSVTDAALFQDPFYATGFPISEAYWAYIKVGGAYQDVLLQCFQRRCLTYTPGNDPGWQVEAGNVGLHYYTWRYE